MKTICVTGIVLILAILAGCIKEFEAPEWDVNFDLPLMNKTYYMHEIEDSTDFIIRNDSLFVKYEGDLETETIDDSIHIKANNLNSYPYVPITPDTTMQGSLNILEESSTDYLRISCGIISRWIVDVDIQHNTGNLQTIILQFPDVKDQDGNVLEKTYTSQDFGHNEIDLSYVSDSEYYTVGDINSTEILDSLTVKMTSSYDTPAVGDMIRLSFEEDIYLLEMKGLMYNKVFQIDDYAKDNDINYPENLDNTVRIAPDGAKLFIHTVNGMGFQVRFRGKLTAINTKTGKRRFIRITDSDSVVFKAAVSFDEPSASTFALTDSIGYLANIFPDRFELTEASYVIGGDGGDGGVEGFARAGSGVSGSFTGEAPFIFSLMENTITPDTTYSQTISSDNRDDIDEYLKSGGVSIILDNTFPVSAGVSLYFSSINDTTEIFHNPLLKIPGPGESTMVNAMSKDSLFIFLDSDEIRNTFLNDEIFIGLRLHMKSTGGQVIIEPDDNINVKVHLDAKLHIKQ